MLLLKHRLTCFFTKTYKEGGEKNGKDDNKLCVGRARVPIGHGNGNFVFYQGNRFRGILERDKPDYVPPRNVLRNCGGNNDRTRCPS